MSEDVEKMEVEIREAMEKVEELVNEYTGILGGDFKQSLDAVIAESLIRTSRSPAEAIGRTEAIKISIDRHAYEHAKANNLLDPKWENNE